MSLHARETSHEKQIMLSYLSRSKTVNINVHNIIFKMPPSRKSHSLLIKSTFSERKDIEKMTNVNKPQIISLCIEKRTNFESHCYLNPHICTQLLIKNNWCTNGFFPFISLIVKRDIKWFQCHCH